MRSAVARRYARALFALAKEENTLPSTADELGRVASVASDPSVGPVLRDPLLSATSRHELAEMLVRELLLSDLLGRFTRLLADRQRLGELPDVAEHFQHLLDREMGRVRVTIRSASTLDATQEQSLIAVFGTLTRKDVIPTVIVDAELLGGVVVEVEGKVYDGSVRTHFERLANQLTTSVSP